MERPNQTALTSARGRNGKGGVDTGNRRMCTEHIDHGRRCTRHESLGELTRIARERIPTATGAKARPNVHRRLARDGLSHLQFCYG